MLVMNITKLAYHQARPYWVNTNIIAYSCSSQYGNPSGHSETSMGFALIMWLDYCRTQDSHWWKKVVGFFVATSFGVSIAYSRLFLGVHSLNQCLFGLLLGIWVAFTMEFCVRVHLDASVTLLTENKV